jgi:hypothetical protein
MLVWSLSTSPDVQLVTEEPMQAGMPEPGSLFTTSTPLVMVSQEVLESATRLFGINADTNGPGMI